MIKYKFSKTETDQNYLEYEMLEYTYTMENETGNDIPEATGGCIHTATLAVCTVLVIFVLFLGCTGNGIVLFNALTTKRLRSNFDLLVINLAGADFIMCTCLSPIFLFLLFSDSSIPKVFCGSILFLGVTSGLLSLLSVVSIAGHRYCRVVGRLRRPLTLVQTSAMVGIIWLISIGVALGGTFHVTSTWQEQTINECQNVVNSGDSVRSNFVLYFLCPVTMASLTVIIMCYGIIAKIVGEQSGNEHVATLERSNDYLDEGTCEHYTSGNHNFSSSMADKCVPSGGESHKDNAGKAVTICFVVIITVTLCWGPLVTSQLVELATGDSIILYQVKLCGIALIFLNSALDPYLYGHTNSRIKHKYARLLYKFARCEYTVQSPSRLKKSAKKTLETCPLKSSPVTHDTNTVLGCPCLDLHVDINNTDSDICQMCCYKTAKYTQNILLLNYADGKYQTQLCNNDFHKGCEFSYSGKSNLHNVNEV